MIPPHHEAAAYGERVCSRDVHHDVFHSITRPGSRGFPNGRAVPQWPTRTQASFWFSPDDAAARTRLLPNVRWAEPNVTYHAAVIPNDPDYPLQTQFPQIGAPAAWDTRTDASSVVVAVLDSGVDITNPDLTANIWANAKEIAGDTLDNDGNGFVDDVQGWNFIENSNDSRPQLSAGATVAGLNHGTVIAGIIGAQGNNGVAGTGVAWNAKILPVRVLDSTGSGSTVTVAQGIAYAVKAGADIINLSFVGSGVSPTLAAAIVEAQTAGVLIVAAAGNENLDLDVTPQYPACYDGVLGIASVDSNDVKSSFSNYGSCIDLVAPGGKYFEYTFLLAQPRVRCGEWYGLVRHICSLTVRRWGTPLCSKPCHPRFLEQTWPRRLRSKRRILPQAMQHL